jgi:hypothetical protein
LLALAFMQRPALAQALGFGHPGQGFMIVSFDVAALQTILRGVSGKCIFHVDVHVAICYKGSSARETRT